MKIEIQKGSILHEEVDAIVNPADSSGHMGGGVADVIKRVGGQEIEDEAIHNAPIFVGTAIATASGVLKCKYVIHTSTIESPGERSDEHKIKCALEAALDLAEQLGLSSIAVPGLGTGVGRVKPAEAAKVMMHILKQHKAVALQEVILVDINEEMVRAWEKHI